ncbi:hypothetical protein V12B01_08732 [Vibrio splendidus 12B01]|nr:hypothetical protein V12B01_08732 [Vibrio splendidus 12B01]EAQ52991.1 hypothetical protein MED222_01147 [Vibrio sp. MED222]
MLRSLSAQENLAEEPLLLAVTQRLHFKENYVV